MSELKVYHCNEWHNEYTEFYLKSAADKVIAEKDKEIAELKNLVDEFDKDFEIVDNQNERLLKIVRHQKYKRCLGIAAVCFEKSYSTTLVKYDEESGFSRNFYDWWGNCWLALAEEPTWAKFLQLIRKEAK